MPHFYKGYDERLDLTEDEWLEQQMYDSMGEYDEPMSYFIGNKQVSQLEFEDHLDAEEAIEGESYEDTYIPGVPDYDRFNRPSWEVED